MSVNHSQSDVCAAKCTTRDETAVWAHYAADQSACHMCGLPIATSCAANTPVTDSARR